MTRWLLSVSLLVGSVAFGQTPDLIKVTHQDSSTEINLFTLSQFIAVILESYL